LIVGDAPTSSPLRLALRLLAAVAVAAAGGWAIGAGQLLTIPWTDFHAPLAIFALICVIAIERTMRVLELVIEFFRIDREIVRDLKQYDEFLRRNEKK
jgi:hypothetical protein